MKKNLLLIILVFLIVIFTLPVQAQTEEDVRDISPEFLETIDMLIEDGKIPSDDGDFYYADDFSVDWAQMYWYQWYYVLDEEVRNFVVRTNISWSSASNTPQWADSGCGFVFREKDEQNHLKANLALDGSVYINGYANNKFISYGKKSFASHSTKGEAEFVLVANDGTVSIYIDGRPIHTASDVLIVDPGMLAYVVVSGTNKDYGTRCDFNDMEFFIF